MVQPNPPRFLREGDVLEFTVKVSNQSKLPQSGTVRLTLPTPAPARVSMPICKTVRPIRALNWPPRNRRASPGSSRSPTAWGRSATRRSARHGQSLRRRGRLLAGAVPPRAGDRIAAAADPRPADQGVRFPQTARVGQVEDHAEPESHGADGLEAGLVRGDGLAVPDGVSLRVHRARRSIACMPTPWPGTSPTAIPRSAASSTSGRTRPRSTARWKRTRT